MGSRTLATEKPISKPINSPANCIPANMKRATKPTMLPISTSVSMLTTIGMNSRDCISELIRTEGNKRKVTRMDSPPLTTTGIVLSPPKTGMTTIMELTLKKIKIREEISS